MDYKKDAGKERGTAKDNSEGMKTREAIKETELELAIKYLNQMKHDQFTEFGYINQAIPLIIELLQRGEIDRKIIEKMKNDKYDVWISLPGYFTNMPKFVRDVEKDIEKEVIKWMKLQTITKQAMNGNI